LFSEREPLPGPAPSWGPPSQSWGPPPQQQSWGPPQQSWGPPSQQSWGPPPGRLLSNSLAFRTTAHHNGDPYFRNHIFLSHTETATDSSPVGALFAETCVNTPHNPEAPSRLERGGGGVVEECQPAAFFQPAAFSAAGGWTPSLRPLPVGRSESSPAPAAVLLGPAVPSVLLLGRPLLRAHGLPGTPSSLCFTPSDTITTPPPSHVYLKSEGSSLPGRGGGVHPRSPLPSGRLVPKIQLLTDVVVTFPFLGDSRVCVVPCFWSLTSLVCGVSIPTASPPRFFNFSSE